MLRIRLKRLGRKKHPYYRIVVMNKRDRRNGRPLQELGFYDPMAKELKLDKAAMQEWMSKGAQPSETVSYLFEKAADDGSLVQLPKKPKKEHLGEANQAKAVKEESEAEAEAAAEIKAEEAQAAVDVETEAATPAEEADAHKVEAEAEPQG